MRAGVLTDVPARRPWQGSQPAARYPRIPSDGRRRVSTDWCGLFHSPHWVARLPLLRAGNQM